MDLSIIDIIKMHVHIINNYGATLKILWRVNTSVERFNGGPGIQYTTEI